MTARTGFKIRILREGEMRTVPIEESTRDEWDEYIASRSREELTDWVYLLLGYALGSVNKSTKNPRQ